ncbi:NTP/NDP exchange transporter [Candidatus Palauibacter sp.]|uniref:NTP/NDP exchange transporter n=1 Tax=Candidatus Palauibacter sp. TaxID=3101350 RepID=UPI003B01EABA
MASLLEVIDGFTRRVLNMRRGEFSLAMMSALFFFLVLCGYFFLRPVREAMGVARGMDELRWLFAVTSLASLFAVLVFGGVVARTNRRRFIPIAYLFVIACLIGFAALLIQDVRAGGGLIGTDAETGLARGVGYTFYVWLSVINLFSTSVFWAFMVDVFDVDQGKRMFPFIGIGGTLGAFLGGRGANFVSGLTESPYLPAGLMLIGAGCFALAIAVMLILDRIAGASNLSRLGSGPAGGPMAADGGAADGGAAGTGGGRRGEGGTRIGGGSLEGLRAVFTSPYLLGVGLWVVFMAVSNTLIYFTQANVILGATDTFSQRVGSFADFDSLAQLATLLTQIFVTTHLIRKLGVGWTLAILPVVTVLGFIVLAVWPIYGVMLIFQAVHRATRYAVSRPSRETLFSVVPPAEKYKGKPIVDVFLYRGGDLAGAGIDGLFAMLGLGLAWVAMSTAPLAGMWIALSIGLGHAQARRISS